MTMHIAHQIWQSLGPQILSVFWTFSLGIAIERFLPAENVFSGPGLVRNCVIGFFFLFSWQLTLIGAAWIFVRPWHGLISVIAVSDRGNAFKAIVLVFVWLAMRDFFYYWLHRLQHASGWLWAEHAVHHSDEHVNVTTSTRHHWLEAPLTVLFINIPLLLLLNPPIITITIVSTILGLTEFTNHMNFRFGLGRFSWIIATPQNHRIHHSRLEEHSNKNFAAFLPIWDVIFGTYYAPKKDEYPPSGLASGERVTTAREALFLPFVTWHRMIFGRSEGN